jgi:hypothetical protein
MRNAIAILCLVMISSAAQSADRAYVKKNSPEFRRLMLDVPGTKRVWPANQAWVNYETLSRAGRYFRGRFAATPEAACKRSTGYSFMLDDSHWKSPIEKITCPDGSPAFHAVLK